MITLSSIPSGFTVCYFHLVISYFDFTYPSFNPADIDCILTILETVKVKSVLKEQLGRTVSRHNCACRFHRVEFKTLVPAD